MTQSEPAVATPPPGAAAERLFDDLDQGRRRRHILVWVAGLGALLIVTLPVAVVLGPVGIPPSIVTRIVLHHLFGWPQAVSWSDADDSIVWLVRMPRVLLGAAVGAGLAITGVALQALVRNVLADSYILGITSGASTGAAATILFGIGADLGASSLTASAFLGALIATGVLFWLLGSLSLASWSSVGIAALVVAAALTVLLLWGRRFDALAIGDDTARTLGVAPARIVFAPRELPLGVVTAFVGAPLLVILVRRFHPLAS